MVVPLVRPIERLQQESSPISVPALSQIAAEAAFDGRLRRWRAINARLWKTAAS